MCFVFLFGSSVPVLAAGSTASPAPDVKIVINDNEINLNGNTAYYQDSHLLLPLRLVFESMGSDVQWDNIAKSIHAVRNGVTVDLNLNSNLAYINSEAVTLETPAIAINSSTYVPLRFVGEAFGGTVDWIAETKTVNIVLADSAVRAVNMNLYLNNIPVSFQTAPLIINNEKCLPLDEFLTIADGLLPEEYNFSWLKGEDGSYVVTFDGVTRTFYPDQDKLYINGAEASLVHYPVTVEGTVYMPMKLIQEVLNGTLSYDAKTKSDYIYIVRAKFKTQFLTTTTDNGIKPVNIPSAVLGGNRILTVCDDPEVISPDVMTDDSAVLWLSNPVSLPGKSSQEHRVFAWHINQMDESLRFGVVIENIGKTILTISDTKHFARTTANSWAEYDVGLPLAEAVLNNSMNTTLPMDIKLEPGQRLLLQEFTVKDGCLIGMINDFKVTNNNKSTNGKYRVRIVTTSITDSDLREIDSSPLPLKSGRFHTRGNWAASQLVANTPSYEVGSDQVAYSISNGVTDNLYTVNTSLPNSWTPVQNIGHFGATYQVNIPIVNNTGSVKTVKIQLSSRGGVYAGAVKTPDGVFLIPELKAATGMANLYEYQAPVGNSTVTLEVMHAGGSYLPVAFEISTASE